MSACILRYSSLHCPKTINGFILKSRIEAHYSGRGQLYSVWLLHWREWERKGANVRRRIGREDSQCASTSAAAVAEHLPDLPCLQLPIVCASLIEISLPAEVSRSLLQPSPPNTHFLWSLVILSSAVRDCPSGPSLIYPSFLNI